MSLAYLQQCIESHHTPSARIDDDGIQVDLRDGRLANQERAERCITEDVMLKWRLLVEEGRKIGHTFSQPDLIIAATAHITT
jgi:hypothetical protein